MDDAPGEVPPLPPQPPATIDPIHPPLPHLNNVPDPFIEAVQQPTVAPATVLPITTAAEDAAAQAVPSSSLNPNPNPISDGVERSSDHDSNGDHDESDSDGEDEQPPATLWALIPEDKSEPCQDELAYIESKEEHSALDEAYWQKEAFFDINDPEISPLGCGTIDWIVERFNGTKEEPNNENLMYSPTVNIAGLDWRIKFYSKGNGSEYLSVYLECVSMQSPEYEEYEDFQHLPFPFMEGQQRFRKLRTVAAQLAVVMYNPAEPRVYECQSEAHQFSQKSTDYGWKYFNRMPRYEIYLRQHTQRQAILRNDKLGFRAYIRVIHDPTSCMWLPPSLSVDDLTLVTGLRPFTKSLQYIAAAIPLLHFQPFREFIKTQIRKGTCLQQWLHPLLLKMYTRMRSENFGVGSGHQGDVMEMLWRINYSFQHDYRGTEYPDKFKELVGTCHAERASACGTNRLNTKDFPSIQLAVDAHAKPFYCPQLLTLELQRQEHNKKERKWKKLTHKVDVSDQLNVQGHNYILFSFVTHCGHLQSSRYNCYVRPRGIGKGWYAYHDGKVTRLTEKQARQKHSGPDDDEKDPKAPENGYDSPFSEFHVAEGEVTCVVTYVRDDVKQQTFDAPETEEWLPKHLEPDDYANPPQTAVHETFASAEPALSAALSQAETERYRLQQLATAIETAARVATPIPPLMEGEDVVMRDVDDDDDDESTFEAVEDAHPNSADLDKGTKDWLGQEYYEGSWNTSRRYHGGGHLIAVNGDEYLGSFKDGVKSGWGKMIYSSTGDIYEGEWLNDAHHGRGKMVEYSSGNVYEGQFKEGRKHGDFVLRGKITEEDKSCCTLCYDKDISTAFYDCGHVVACRDCAAQVDTCPVCRKRVLHRLQLYGVRMTAS